jgi:two-component system, OmpR family, response regulator
MEVLVIEDEPRISTVLAHGLEAEGFVVESADNGKDGLARAVGGHHNLVILDLLLPRLDGLTVLREINRRRPELPVLIMSARSDLRTKLRGFELGACDYVPKPFAFAELLARIRLQLRVQASDDGNLLTAGGIVLDLTRRQARIDGRVADLSEREFRLLHHLVRHAGEVVSRESVLAAVWGRQFDSRSNVVDVCVRRLRKKLGNEAPIETVRHAGYRLTTA